MVNDPSAVTGAVVLGKKKKKPRPGSPEQLARQAARDKRKLFADQAARDREATYAAQRHSEITDGASQTISKRGVRQRGTSDAQAGTMIREEIAAGKANPQAAPSAGGGFQGTGMDGKPGFQLRTEAERQARIASSPLPQVGKPLFSTKGRDQGAKGGDFTSAQSEAYANKAQAMGFGSARQVAPDRVGSPSVGGAAAPTGNTFNSAPSTRVPPGGSPAPVTPAPAATPKAINPNLTSTPSVAVPLRPSASAPAGVMRDTTRMMPAAPPKQMIAARSAPPATAVPAPMSRPTSPNMAKISTVGKPATSPSGPTATPAAPTRPPMMANTSQALGLGAGGINRAVSGIQAGAAMPGKIAQGTAALASTAALGPIQMGTAQARVAGRKLGTVMGAIKKDLSTARR